VHGPGDRCRFIGENSDLELDALGNEQPAAASDRQEAYHDAVAIVQA